MCLPQLDAHSKHSHSNMHALFCKIFYDGDETAQESTKRTLSRKSELQQSRLLTIDPPVMRLIISFLSPIEAVRISHTHVRIFAQFFTMLIIWIL